MEKQRSSFYYLLVLVCLSNISLFGAIRADTFDQLAVTLAPAPPAVYSPVIYWQNCSKPLVAIPSAGGTLNWYLTNLPTEFPISTAPIPITTIIGSTTTYYVSQTIAGVESTRTPIIVKVEANSGATILNYRCDRSQIPIYSLDYTPPATISNSVLFDWTNNNAFISQTYFCTYSVQGGASVTSFNPKNESHFIVSNLLPGQSVELTLTSASHPCVPSQTITCSVPCGTSTVTPNFASIPTSYCLNESTTNLPLNSDDSPAITGTWSPEIVKTDTAGTFDYIFTPNRIMFPCALTKTLTMTVGPVEPDFSDFSICSGDSPPLLSSMSPNRITGDWLPLTIDNMDSASYIFTPAAGQACAPTAKTIVVTVNPSNVIVNLDWTVTDAFTKNQIVTVTDPVGVNYLYQLDDGPFQESTAFENVSLGTHSITVKDVNGCSVLRNDNVLVIDYPKFFTPNGDDYNDRWNIFELQDDLASKIHIFDRYGKLLKEIRPGGTGWDGTYNGREMPGNDYWFVVEYLEDGIFKKYKSHFSLKR
ncbi:T9SS type B sorting domain-containing protein [Flavobacterium hiemivividum]|uniref:T9SS type B sorting domain-containing protein n=1 Tax=Flavobacterium hiemivividum TaxID=2541734 RepID=A0A4V2Z229_9FLAO|nr:T9SS type B sorting domain-containing protein [Flavobacterium hiemivividum]TDE06068.1 T9SS type B sorting domain-containing protein [Flavobacterium hiemivividum]